MSDRTPDLPEDAQRLMMAALDGELSADQRARWRRLMESDPAVRREYQRMLQTKEATRAMRIRKPPEEAFDVYWRDVYNRFERGVAWILVSLAAIALAGYGIWKALGNLWDAPDMPLFIKVSLFSLCLGGAILVLSVIREKVFLRKRDPYKEIQR